MKGYIGWLYADLALVLFIIMLVAGPGGSDDSTGTDEPIRSDLVAPGTTVPSPSGPTAGQPCQPGLVVEPVYIFVDLQGAPIAGTGNSVDPDFAEIASTQIASQIDVVTAEVGLVQTFTRGSLDRTTTSHWVNLVLLADYPSIFNSFIDSTTEEGYDARMRRFIGSRQEANSSNIEIFLLNDCITARNE